MTATARPRLQVRPRRWTFGPFKGCWMSQRAPSPDERAFLYLTENMVFVDPVVGGAVARRPSDEESTFDVGGAATVQLLHMFKQNSGPKNVCVRGGELYVHNSATLVWERKITTAQLTAAGITVSAAAVVCAADFNDTMVINDGVNRPFTWDGTAGGGLVSLTNAPSRCFGRPGVYYGKVFFIKDVAAASADRSVLVWSEENQANTGYEAGGFNNAWKLTQSGSGALYVVVGTNEGLYYFRRASWGIIRGAVTPVFSADGVHEGGSTTLGTTSPRGATYHDGWVYWTDQKGRPHRVAAGSTAIDPLWLAMQDVFAEASPPVSFQMMFDPDVTAAQVALSQVVAVPAQAAVAFVLPQKSSGLASAWLFSTWNGHLLGVWTWNTATSAGYAVGHLWDDINGRDQLALGGTKNAVSKTLATPPVTASTYGYVAGVDVGDSGLGLGWVVTLPFAGHPDSDVVWHFDEVDALVVGTNLAFKLYSYNDAQADPFTLIGSVTSDITGRPDHRITWGLNREHRWFAPQIARGQSGTYWGVSWVSLLATPVAAYPERS